jgi:threonine dehydratase
VASNTEDHLTLSDYLQKILTARVYELAVETPVDPMPRCSSRVGSTLLLKREDFQPVFSFKIRGALNKIASLDAPTRTRGVICASAGNHAQGVALAAAHFDAPATIVMPVTTPAMKVSAVRALGATVVLKGESYAEAAAHAAELQVAHGATPIHPFDDPLVIAGQGTVAVELLRQIPGDLDAVFVPVGGGGLICGMAAYIKAVRPEIRVVGVQTVDSCAMAQSLERGERVTLDEVGLFSDGTAVKTVGRETFRLATQLIDDMLLVSNDEVCAAIKDIFEDTRTICEPAGALALAGMKRYSMAQSSPLTLCGIATGANMNFGSLRFVAERAEEREALLAVTIPERPGSFRMLASLLGEHSITEFNYRMSDTSEAHVFVGVAADNSAEIASILSNLGANGFTALDLSDNDLAKEHLRHMVGGRSAAADDERLYRFLFPERPGALLRFLDAMQADWNISLFHYRNQGSDVGRVLVGIQVPSASEPAFEAFLHTIGYPNHSESDNLAYQLFLR